MIAMGVKPGPKIGNIFDRLLDMVLENPQLNENEKLRELVLKFNA